MRNAFNFDIAKSAYAGINITKFIQIFIYTNIYLCKILNWK